MKDVLLNIGSIVIINDDTDFDTYIIVGKRVINFNSMKAWDYYSVPYPDGLKKDKSGNDETGYYFNHSDINKIIYESDTVIHQ